MMNGTSREFSMQLCDLIHRPFLSPQSKYKTAYVIRTVCVWHDVFSISLQNATLIVDPKTYSLTN